MAFIRPYKPSDWDRTAFICRATLPPSLNSSEPGTRLAPYIWTHQYTTLSPGNCFVLDDGSGTAVGYVIGTPDVFAFAAAYPAYVTTVLQGEQGHGDVPPPPAQLDEKLPWTERDADGRETVSEAALAQLAYSPKLLLLEGVEGKADLVTAFRATMHIDLLPPFQGAGWGRKMIDTFIASVKEAVAASGGVLDSGKGVHIGVSGENTKVVPFYEKCGFSVYPGGEKEGNVWMVKEF